MIMSAANTSTNSNKRSSNCMKRSGGLLTKPVNKRMKMESRNNVLRNMYCYNGGNKDHLSSSEDESDCEFNEESSMMNIRSPIVDQDISRAVGQYSDEEENVETDNDNSDNDNNSDCNNGFSRSKNYDDSKFLQRRSNSSILNTNYNSSDSGAKEFKGIFSNKRYSISVADLVANNNSNNNHNHNSNTVIGAINAPANSMAANVKHSANGISSEDFSARNRCLDYLVNAIDEAWSRYCDGTSYEEEINYDYDNTQENPSAKALSLSPAKYSSDDDEGYKSELSNYTSVTEYDSDMAAFKNGARSMSIMNTQRPETNLENVRLQELKDRLTKAKYYLEEFVDSCSINECISFWKRWDLIKYSTIELVEDDDEDEVVELKIDELESGRYYGSLS